MTFEEFNNLFVRALQTAVKNAEELLHRQIPSNLEIILHGAGHSGEVMNALAAAETLYLGEEKFFRIIDVSVFKVSRNKTTIFVRASSHAPSTMERTWNDPPGSGPFKQLIPTEIKVEDLAESDSKDEH
jgi:hypothetical protein